MIIQDIKNYMKEKKITQIELSNKSGVPIDTIKQILRGKTKHPRLDTMNAITEALGIPYELPTQPTFYRLAWKNCIVVFDNSGDKYEFNFKQEELQQVLNVCKALTQKY